MLNTQPRIPNPVIDWHDYVKPFPRTSGLLTFEMMEEAAKSFHAPFTLNYINWAAEVLKEQGVGGKSTWS